METTEHKIYHNTRIICDRLLLLSTAIILFIIATAMTNGNEQEKN